MGALLIGCGFAIVQFLQNVHEPPPLPANAPPGFHQVANSSASTCNIDCTYCFFRAKEALYPNDKQRTPQVTVTLQNASKHAGICARFEVTLERDKGALGFNVQDAGPRVMASPAGKGPDNLRRRPSEVGGGSPSAHHGIHRPITFYAGSMPALRSCVLRSTA